MTFPRGAAGFTNPGLFTKLVVIVTKPGQGIFVYSPNPGPGNLIASIAPVAGTDHGNAYLAGIVAYQLSNVSVNSAEALVGGASIFYSAPNGSNGAGPWTQQGSLAYSVPNGFLLFNGFPGGIDFTQNVQTNVTRTTGNVFTIQNLASSLAPIFEIIANAVGDPYLGMKVNGDAFSRLIIDENINGFTRILTGSGAVAGDTALLRTNVSEWSTDPIKFNNAGAAEVWQVVGSNGAAFAGTWVNAAAPGVNLKYRRNAAPFNSVHWVGRITNTVAQVAGSAITAAVPTAYRPTNTHDIACVNFTTGALIRVSIGSTGILTCQTAIAANDVVTIPDISIGLDA